MTSLEEPVGQIYGNIEVQAAAAIDTENLENYSKSTLIRIIKWQHRHFQECHNEASSWKSKYKSLKLEYKRAIEGKDWVD